MTNVDDCEVVEFIRQHMDFFMNESTVKFIKDSMSEQNWLHWQKLLEGIKDEH